MAYRLPNPSHSDFGEGETLLEAISDGRVFDIEPYGVGFKLTERCDDYFSLVLTAPQLYQLGTELRELAKIQLASEETTTMSNLSPAAQAILDAFRTSPTGQGCLAAALRAAAAYSETVEIRTAPGMFELDEVIRLSDLFAIADELDATYSN